MYKKIKVIGFDADDTLWANEDYFRHIEDEFAKLLHEYSNKEESIKDLFRTEINNLNLYGYGIKGFMLSMIETAHHITKGALRGEHLMKIIDMGKIFLDKPVELLPGVNEVLHRLKNTDYKLIVATKGDLLDQERKLKRSGLEDYFHHVEVMSDKKEENYQKLLAHLDIHPNEFLMVGNSIKSDVMPVVNIGGMAVHIPFHTTWEHEMIDETHELGSFAELTSIAGLIDLLM